MRGSEGAQADIQVTLASAKERALKSRDGAERNRVPEWDSKAYSAGEAAVADAQDAENVGNTSAARQKYEDAAKYFECSAEIARAATSLSLAKDQAEPTQVGALAGEALEAAENAERQAEAAEDPETCLGFLAEAADAYEAALAAARRVYAAGIMVAQAEAEAIGGGKDAELAKYWAPEAWRAAESKLAEAEAVEWDVSRAVALFKEAEAAFELAALTAGSKRDELRRASDAARDKAVGVRTKMGGVEVSRQAKAVLAKWQSGERAWREGETATGEERYGDARDAYRTSLGLYEAVVQKAAHASAQTQPHETAQGGEEKRGPARAQVEKLRERIAENVRRYAPAQTVRGDSAWVKAEGLDSAKEAVSQYEAAAAHYREALEQTQKIEAELERGRIDILMFYGLEEEYRAAKEARPSRPRDSFSQSGQF